MTLFGVSRVPALALHLLPLRSMSSPELAFEVWKTRLREDCVREDKLQAFENLGDYCLKILWECGLQPLVNAIVEDGKKVAQ